MIWESRERMSTTAKAGLTFRARSDCSRKANRSFRSLLLGGSEEKLGSDPAFSSALFPPRPAALCTTSRRNAAGIKLMAHAILPATLFVSATVGGQEVRPGLRVPPPPRVQRV